MSHGGCAPRGILGGHVFEDERCHSVLDAAGKWRARLLLAAPAWTVPRGQVNAAPAGHSLCIGWEPFISRGTCDIRRREAGVRLCEPMLAEDAYLAAKSIRSCRWSVTPNRVPDVDAAITAAVALIDVDPKKLVEAYLQGAPPGELSSPSGTKFCDRWSAPRRPARPQRRAHLPKAEDRTTRPLDVPPGSVM
jgi:hypothetical protein